MKKLFFVLLFIAGCTQGETEPQQFDAACYEGYCFELELAITQYEQARGLSFREFLEVDRGMLFIFDNEGIYQFWMKDTKLPLDIIWLDSNGEVVYIKENALPCTPDYCPSINPGKSAKYVLEINGGMSESIGLAKGDVVELDIKTTIE